MNKTAEKEEADHVESVILSNVCNLEMAASAIEGSSLVRPQVTDGCGGGETAAVWQSVLVSPPPAGVLPVLRSGDATAAHASLQQVDGLAALPAHPVPLHAGVDPLLESLTEGVPVEEGQQDTDNLHQQYCSNTDAVLQLRLEL